MTELALLCAIGVLGLAFAAYLTRWVLACPPGDGELARVAALVRTAAEGFFRKQSSIIGAVSAVFGGAIFLAYGLLRHPADGDPVPALELGVWLTASFALGSLGSVVAGRVSTWIALATGPRVAAGVRRSTDLAVQIGLRGGAISGLVVTSLGLFSTTLLFAAVFASRAGFSADPAAALRLAPTIPFMIAGNALGASFAALLAQLGGGTFAKAADLGADLASASLGLGEDDRENPGAIADLAGDVAGGGAGRAAAVFESTVAENLGAMLVGGLLFRANPRLPSVLALLLFPLVTRAFGLLGAIFGVMVVRTDDREDPRSALSRGLYVTALLHGVGFAGAAKWLLGAQWLHFLGCGAVGIAGGLGLLAVTQYYTEHRHRPVRDLAEASRGGPTFAVLSGLGLAFESTVAPFAVLIVVSFGAFEIGSQTHLVHGGLFGAAVATMGLLGIGGYMATLDAFAPIVDNAAGYVEMTVARDRPDVRGRTVVLDTVGNSVKAFSSSWSSATAALVSFLLVAAYLDETRRRLVPSSPALVMAPPGPILHLDRPEVLFGALVGVLLVVWLAGRCVLGVVRPARRMFDEVRRQLKDRPPDFVPDYEACLEMVSGAALRLMIAPAVVVAAAPIVVGVALRLARAEDNPILLADSVAALVMAGTIAGVLGSLLFGIAGGAWDNAKKYIATGAHGGRHLVDDSGARVDNPTHSAAVVGDTVGDPLKDLVGPAMHVLVKVLPVVTIVFLPFFV